MRHGHRRPSRRKLDRRHRVGQRKADLLAGKEGEGPRAQRPGDRGRKRRDPLRAETGPTQGQLAQFNSPDQAYTHLRPRRTPLPEIVMVDNSKVQEQRVTTLGTASNVWPTEPILSWAYPGGYAG